MNEALHDGMSGVACELSLDSMVPGMRHILEPGVCASVEAELLWIAKIGCMQKVDFGDLLD